MPTTDDRDKWIENENRNQARRERIFKVVEIILWLIVVIIVVTVCLAAMYYSGYFSTPAPIDALPPFIQ